MRIIAGLAILLVLPLVGCKAELKTADYLYPTKNFIAQTQLVEEDSFFVTHGAWKDGTLTMASYSVFAGQILPPLGKTTVSVQSNEILEARVAGTNRLPITIDTGANFPPGSKEKIFSTSAKFSLSGKEYDACIKTEGDHSESLFCPGLGKVRTKEIALNGATHTSEVIAFRTFETDQLAEQSGLAILLDLSAEKSLPVAEQGTYKKWVNEACGSQVRDHGVKLSFASTSMACGCLYQANKDGVEAILMDPSSSIPLGTGSEAEKFYNDTLSCVRQVTGFKGPLS